MKIALIRCCFIGVVCLLSGSVFSNEGSASVTADQAMKWLREGNRRYVEGRLQHPNVSKDRRDDTTTKGQHPFCAVLTCSDSRVPVEYIFDKGIGDVFVIRVAGNVASEDEIGSMEYAAEHLQTPVIVVLGHSECGAVTAAVKESDLTGNIKSLVEKIGPAVETIQRTQPDLQGVYKVRAAIKENVKLGIKNMETKSLILKELIEKGKLKVVGAIYNIYTGEIEWLEE